MKMQSRRAVSPIIATLLLIAITVAAGVIVYVFVTGLSSNLTKSGGGQVTEQVIMTSYNFPTSGSLTVYFQNTGSSSISISQTFFDGTPISPAYSVSNPIAAQQDFSFTIAVTSLGTVTSGTGYTIKIVTADGGIFPFNVIAGSTG